ncbi:MAG: peptidoglycan DD-metalloendopeptidase family protein [Bacteroidota bacterium]
MKKISILLVLFLCLQSCNKSEKGKETIGVKPEPILVEFGFTLNNFDVVNDTIINGDTFGSIIEKENLQGRRVYDIVEKVKDTFDVRIVRKGKAYTMLRSKDKSKKLQVFIYQPDRLSYYVIDFRDSIKVHKVVKPMTIKRRVIVGQLDGSLSGSLEQQKVSGTLANKIATVYAWSIDFFKLQKGDKFGVIFTERYINDSIYDGIDSLEAAFFEYKGKMIYAFPYGKGENSHKIGYYDQDGKALKNFFLKAPIKFINITSRFSKNRFHPVQRIWKAHKGTDYAAAKGTPIMSTAAGIVEQTGFTAGNGNFVKVKHNRTYSTQYLHMSKILVRRGQRVSQGQTIGKVGSTGLATGPHVCYRFWKNGVQVDALRLKLPNSEPMSKKSLPAYLEKIAPLKRELDSVAQLKFKK